MSVTDDNSIVDVSGIEGQTYRIGPEWVTLKVPGSATGNQYLVIEVTTPAGGGPPIHTHSAAEVFFVAEGEFDFPTIRDGIVTSLRGTAGSSVHIPGGIPHTYKNVGDGYGRLIGVLSPAPEIEGFFRESGVEVLDRSTLPTLDDQPDFDRLMAACEKYDLKFLEPDHF